jgi:hypothetical protein
VTEQERRQAILRRWTFVAAPLRKDLAWLDEQLTQAEAERDAAVTYAREREAAFRTIQAENARLEGVVVTARALCEHYVNRDQPFADLRAALKKLEVTGD